jgi:orotidine-5'-phosphate decarboxylase
VNNSPDGEKLAEVIQVQHNTHPGDPDVTLTELMSRLENEMKRVGLKGKIADLMGKVVPHLNRFAIVGDIAVSTNPNPAALPWAAVRFILLVPGISNVAI